MACISKLSAGFAYDCDTGATGITSALIINKDDVTSFTTDPNNVFLIASLGSGTGYRIDTPKSTLVVTESLKVNEGAPNALSFSVSLTITAQANPGLSKSLISPLTNGSFVLLTRSVENIYRVYGLYYGLSATALDRVSNSNGSWYSVTLSTPEQVIGEDPMHIDAGTYSALYTAAVY